MLLYQITVTIQLLPTKSPLTMYLLITLYEYTTNKNKYANTLTFFLFVCHLFHIKNILLKFI